MCGCDKNTVEKVKKVGAVVTTIGVGAAIGVGIGSAATTSGLAALGGGSIASGGGGMAAGQMVLHAITAATSTSAAAVNIEPTNSGSAMLNSKR